MSRSEGRGAALALSALAGLAVLSGCARHHLYPGYGRSTQEALSLQVVPTAHRGPGLLLTIDGGSAQQIHKNYRRSLATADTREELGDAPEFEAGD